MKEGHAIIFFLSVIVSYNFDIGFYCEKRGFHLCYLCISEINEHMIKATVNNNQVFEIEKRGDHTFVNGQQQSIDSLLLKDGTQHWLVNNCSFRVQVELMDRAEKKYMIHVNGKIFTVVLKEPLDELLHELGMDNNASQKINDLRSPMPGLIVEILVKEGQEIKKGETVIVLEAMKMENSLKATADATVKKIIAVKGAAVEKNEVLVQLA